MVRKNSFYLILIDSFFSNERNSFDESNGRWIFLCYQDFKFIVWDMAILENGKFFFYLSLIFYAITSVLGNFRLNRRGFILFPFQLAFVSKKKRINEASHFMRPSKNYVLP